MHNPSIKLPTLARFTAAAGLATLAAALLSGCGMNGNSGPGGASTTAASAATVSGMVHGGQQPIAGSSIALYAVGTMANGSASTSLLTSAATSDSNGNFSVTGKYFCPTATSQVYIVATGGNSGGGNNTGIAEAAALGSCGPLLAGGSNIFITINELTTVAAAYALAPFEVTTYTNIGSAGNGTTGLRNAFTSAAALVNTTIGAVATPATGVTIPGAEINTLGNILAACVNTSSSASTQCSALFTATGATNTFDAAFAIAKNPGSSNITGLYSNSAGTGAPFQPTLSSQPSDFTVAVNYKGAELLTPYSIAIDANGNAFVTNESGASIVGAPPFSTAFATSTNTATVAGGLAGPRGVAIDTNGYFWIADTGKANVVKIAPLTTGMVASFSGLTSTAIALSGSAADAPVAVTTDRSGDAYFINPNSNTLYAVSSAGVATSLNLASSPFPLSIAYAPNGNLAIGNVAGQICTTTVTLGALTCVAQSPAQAISAVAYNPGTGSGAGYATSTTNAAYTPGAYGPLSGFGPFTGGGAGTGSMLAFDGAGHAFVTGSTSIAEFAAGTSGTFISPTGGFGTINTPIGIAVDGSGNVWTANSGDNSLSIFIGLASPATTPLAAVN